MGFQLVKITILVMLVSLGVSEETWSKGPLLSKVQTKKILSDGKIYLFTSKGCPACVELEKELKSTDQFDNLKVFFNGNEYLLPIERIDAWDENVDQALLKKFGYKGLIPHFSISSNGSFKGAGFLKGSTSEIFNSIDKVELLPLSNEDPKQYATRIGLKMKLAGKKAKFNGSKIILKTLGALRSDPKILPNPRFSPKTEKTNILILGTANTPLDNPVFTGLTINKVKKSLDKVTDIKPIILYGSGETASCDTCQVVKVDEQKDKVREFIKFDVGAIAENSEANISSFFSSSKKKKAEKNLVVLVGHGTPEGFPTWLDPFGQFVPEEMEELHKSSGAQNILISGNCFGGVMAQTVSCAFMAANPNVPASGCWEDADTGKDMPDYISKFFESLNNTEADYNSDGDISFAEAHAFASLNVSDQDQPYTTIDSMADEYYTKNQYLLNKPIKLNALISIARKYATASERAVLENLLSDSSINEVDLSGKPKVGEVDFGPLKSTYTKDGENIKFKNIIVKDEGKLIDLGVDSDFSKIKLHRSYSDQGKVSLFFEKEESSRITLFGEEMRKAAKRAITEKQIPDDYYQAEHNTIIKIQFGPFEGTVMRHDSLYSILEEVKIIDREKFNEFKAKHKFADDAELKSIQFIKEKEEIVDVNMSYLSKKMDKEEPISYMPGIEFDLPEILIGADEGKLKTLKTVAKRLLYKFHIGGNEGKNNKLQEILSCEDQSIAGYLETPSFNLKDMLNPGEKAHLGFSEETRKDKALNENTLIMKVKNAGSIKESN
jgi:hypothetical protein